jgi:hypothetical protein
MKSTRLPIAKSSLEKILKPINRLTESCVLKVKDDLLFTICTSSDNSLILYASTKIPTEIDPFKLNIINIKKLLTGLDCLGDSGEFSLFVENNCLKCQSIDHQTHENISFKYHLVDENIIKETAINIQKIAQLNFDTEFEIRPEVVKKIISAYTFASDASKIYFYSKDKKIYGEIDDKSLQNIDNMSLMISNNLIGVDLDKPLPINIEIFKNLCINKNSLKVKINNEFNVFVFQTQDDENVELKYIVSALVN